jgi:hypothetical protein
MTGPKCFCCFGRGRHCSSFDASKPAARPPHSRNYDVTEADGAEALITPVGAAGKAIQRMM